MNDPTGPLGPVFEPTPTLDMWQAGDSRTPLPPTLVRHMKPPVREGDAGTYHGWPIVRLLGRGGMAVVLHGYDQKLRRDVAIKMIHPDRLNDPHMAARFAREARLTAQVNNPHVITVYSVHDDAECAFLVMEYLHGGTLQKCLREQPVSEQECIRIARDIARGLQAAHDVGLLHRDLKPSNIGFRQPGGHVVIMDFGLARTLCDTDPLTIHGSPMGTPAYMSPEQIQVQKLDHRTDLFSLGTVMYRMVTGQHPFQGSTPVLLCHSIANTPHTPLRHYVPNISPGLEAIIDRLLQKSPAHRFQTAAQVIEALDRLSQPPPSRSGGWAVAGLFILVLLGIVGAYQASRLGNRDGDSGTRPGVIVAADSTQVSGGSSTPDDSPSRSTAQNIDPPVPRPSIPEFLDGSGIIWRSTNQHHAGLVSVDADGVIRLQRQAGGPDNWAMVEAEFPEPPDDRGYLLLEIVELSGSADASWAAKLAPSDGSLRDVELNYGHSAGRFAIMLPQQAGTHGGSLRSRIFVVGSNGAFMRFRGVRIASAVPEGYRTLAPLSAN
jgi:serine/threonine protein kinase